MLYFTPTTFLPLIRRSTFTHNNKQTTDKSSDLLTSSGFLLNILPHV